MLQQRTIKTLTRAVGVGLHSGQRVELTLRPAAPDTGIVFRRIDLAQPVDIPVSAEAVTDTRMASTIGVGAATTLGGVGILGKDKCGKCNSADQMTLREEVHGVILDPVSGRRKALARYARQVGKGRLGAVGAGE